MTASKCKRTAGSKDRASLCAFRRNAGGTVKGFTLSETDGFENSAGKQQILPFCLTNGSNPDDQLTESAQNGVVQHGPVFQDKKDEHGTNTIVALAIQPFLFVCFSN